MTSNRLRDQSQSPSSGTTLRTVNSNMSGLSGGVPPKDVYDFSSSEADQKEILTHLPELSTFDQHEKDSQLFEEFVTPLKPLASPFPSPPDKEADSRPPSEAAPNRASPDLFTTHGVIGSDFTQHNEDISADPFMQNSTRYSSPSTIFTKTSHGQQIFVPSCNISARHSSSPQYFAKPLASSRTESASGLSIHRAPYDWNLPFMTAMYENTPYMMLQHGSRDSEYADIAHIASAAMCEIGAQPTHNGLTSIESTHNPSNHRSATNRQVARSDNHQYFVPAAQNMVSQSPYVSDYDHNNHTVYSTSTSSSNVGNDDSPGGMTFALHTKGNMLKSDSCSTFTAFTKPSKPLTTLQLVNEASHQPYMDSAEVVLQHDNSERKRVESMDYRDSSWQGRSDEHKGWTPYVDFADFPSTMEMLRRMRNDPYRDMPDTATIFTSLAQVNEWREEERKKGCRGQEAQNDDELPRSDEEKAAIVKLLFKAFKSTIEGQSNPQVQRPFEHQVHSNVHVEAVCWQLLEAAILRSEGGPLSYAYEPEKGTKSATDRNSSFAQRIDDLIHALMWEKSVCNNLLKAPKVQDAVDSPSYIGKRTANNRVLNRKKAEISALGKKRLEELKEEHAEQLPRKIKAASRPLTRRGKRSKNVDSDDDSETTEESPRKRHSPDRSALSTPAHRFASIDSRLDGYTTQITPSLSQVTSGHSSPPQFGSPARSTTGSIRANMSGYNLNNIPQPDFSQPTRSISQSPLRQSALLADVGAQHFPPAQYNMEYDNSLAAINTDDDDQTFTF